MPTDGDWKQALELIEELKNKLSQADPRSTEVNRRVIQRAEDFLGAHGRTQGVPRFE